MSQSIAQFFQQLGLNEATAEMASTGVLLLGLLLLASVVFLLARFLLLRIVAAIAKHTETDWDDRLVRHRVFSWFAHLAPAVLLYRLAPVLLVSAEPLMAWIRSGALIYVIVAALLGFDALLNAFLEIYNTFPVSKQVPLKSFVQVAKIALYLAAIIVVLAILLGKSPLFLLSGMGVLASVLMLVFKDPILGLVAGIQLSTNRMLSKGDWIEMGSYGADGDVIDIALTTVKVQNWDKTITTIPTYALISDSFKNWRGMSESGGRRIKRSVFMDQNSVRLCTPEMIEDFAKIDYIADYIRQSQEALGEWNEAHGVDDPTSINGKRLTNIGTFRAYLEAYLQNEPRVNHEMTVLVRHLAPTPTGLPIQIYCFSANTEWSAYESLQADILDHILAAAPEFGLRVFQNPSGQDFRQFGA